MNEISFDLWYYCSFGDWMAENDVQQLHYADVDPVVADYLAAVVLDEYDDDNDDYFFDVYLSYN